MKNRASLDDMRVGFLISHPYHFFIYKSLVEALKDPLLIIERREDTPFEFSSDFLSSLPAKYVVLREHQMDLADRQVDIIFLMTPRHIQNKFPRARKVLMQYGMAKEFYNYGLWRCLADLNLMYGPYSHRMVEGFAVSRPAGNLRMDSYAKEKIGGGGVLFLPTYGKGSSLARFAEALPKLNPDVPITVKLHHASEFADRDIVDQLRADDRITLLDGYQDAFQAISKADIVLSDYSGAIFDALFLDRPVVLFQPEGTGPALDAKQKSIEIERAEELGRVLNTDEELISFFDEIASGEPYPASVFPISDYLSNPYEAVPNVLNLLDQLINDEIKPTIVQESVRTTYARLIAKNARQQRQGPVSVAMKRLKGMLHVR